MNLLVGRALQEDVEFWNQGLFAEDQSDEDFDSKEESSSAGGDSFDSDFGKYDEEVKKLSQSDDAE